MLVLGRKLGESIRIGDGIEITIVGVQGNRVRLGIQAPEDVRVLRSELEEHPGKHAKPAAATESRCREEKSRTVHRHVA